MVFMLSNIQSGRLFSVIIQQNPFLTLHWNISYRLLAYGSGTVQGFNSSDSHDVEITLIDYKQRPTDVSVLLPFTFWIL